MSREKVTIQNALTGDVKSFNANKAKLLVGTSNWRECRTVKSVSTRHIPVQTEEEDKQHTMRDTIGKGPRKWRR